MKVDFQRIKEEFKMGNFGLFLGKRCEKRVFQMKFIRNISITNYAPFDLNSGQSNRISDPDNGVCMSPQ